MAFAKYNITFIILQTKTMEIKKVEKGRVCTYKQEKPSIKRSADGVLSTDLCY
jgi:hypothetical protein